MAIDVTGYLVIWATLSSQRW